MQGPDISCVTYEIKLRRSLKSYRCRRKIYETFREVFSALLSCLICLKIYSWSYVQNYEVYFCNLCLSSSQNFPQYFPRNLSSSEWIRDSFVQLTPSPSSFTEQEKNYVDPTSDQSMKRKFNSIQEIRHIIGISLYCIVLCNVFTPTRKTLHF